MKLPSILLTIILISSAAVFAQPRRGGPPVHRGPAPTAKAAVVSVYDPLSDFAKKGLPKAYVFGGIPNKALAKKAAEMILKGDDDSLPALIGALQIAGFHITDSNQKILFKPLKANGTAFADYEVAGMLRSSFLGIGTTLEKLGKAFANESPALKRFNIGAAMLADIEGARSSGDEQNRFLADLIFELGRDTQGLSTPQSKINMIQASLIDRRFLGDVVDAYEAVSGGQALFEPKDRLNRSAAVSFVNASLSPAAPFASRPVDSPSPGTETAEQAAGYKSKFEKIAKFFGYEHPGKQAMDDLFENMDLLKEVAGGLEKANTIITYFKLIASNMFIEADIDLPNSPLVRTKSSRFIDRGQERILTANFKIYFPNSQQINCVGKALKAASGITGAPGLDFEVPDEGPLKDVPVKWEPLDNALTAPLYMDSLNGKDLYNQKTDDNGDNKIKATGKEQKKNLENQPVAPVPKKERWRVSIATDKMDAEKDLPKIFFGALGLKGGSPVAFLIEAIPEMLGKMALRSFRVDIPVRDWEPCSEDWGGRVHYTKDLRKTVVVRASRTSNGNSTGDGVRTNDMHEEAEITLNPRSKEEVVARAPQKPADVDAFGYYSTKFEGSREADPCCGKTSGNFNTKFVSGTDTRFEKVFQTPFSVGFSGGNADFQLGFTLGGETLPSKIHDYLQVQDSNCPLEKNESYDRNSDGVAVLSALLSPGRYGDRYLDVSGDFLVGSKQYQLPDGSTMNWEWELSRCKNVPQ